ncbi:MAPEG family protein [Legionella dresdenensis]|uniref:MAPEG family protein n=1 Tax=Legionella dresdenensis TaxID=450200 RepID=A0ABV8CIA7_9GAMM
MNTLIVCLFIATIMPYLARIPVGYAMAKAGGYNNNEPRSQQAGLTGFGSRAVAAHQNAFESLLIFAVAVLTALATGHTSALIQNLAITYIISRVVYHILYLIDLASLRSLIWFIGFASSLAILVMCIS